MCTVREVKGRKDKTGHFWRRGFDDERGPPCTHMAKLARFRTSFLPFPINNQSCIRFFFKKKDRFVTEDISSPKFNACREFQFCTVSIPKKTEAISSVSSSNSNRPHITHTVSSHQGGTKVTAHTPESFKVTKIMMLIKTTNQANIMYYRAWFNKKEY